MSATRPDICVILNVGSGKRRGREAIANLTKAFDRYPGRFELRPVHKGSEIEGEARRAASEGFPTVVAAGGDGTICAVASALVGSGARMGVLTFGTFNYFSRSLELPEELDKAVEVLIEGHTRPVDVGEVNGRVFLNNASLGVYAAILEQREDIYRRYGRGRLAAFWSVFVTLIDTRKPLSLRITVDGEPHQVRTPLAFVAKNPYQLEQFELAGVECARSGQFALFLAPDSTRAQLVAFALKLGLRRLSHETDFKLICGKDIVIESTRPRRQVARDGEREDMRSPFRFRVLEGALEVLVPRAETA